ncbi:MAG: alkaline phosphatase family protein [Candidatus Azambacteria bacterium]|nr:alkaline phosphatase family protein [Candidatus Azambacteria bacterium]
MEKPNYKNGSIVNLMSSVGGAFGVKSMYNELALLSAKELKDVRNVVLIVLDGLGYEFLISKESVLHEGLRGKITSVYPPTTSAAITTFATGVAPQQHAVTGWFMHLKEVGTVSTILRFCPRAGGAPFSAQGVSIIDVLDVKTLSSQMEVSAYEITRNDLIDSDYSAMVSEGKTVLGYDTLNGFFTQIKQAIQHHKKRKYIFAYWPSIDSLCHEYGTNSTEVNVHFRELDKKMKAFLRSIQGTDTTVIITADHGLIDVPKERVIKLADHPKLQEYLTLPFCGDSRTKYCYVHPAKAKQFEAYVKTKLRNYCEMHTSEDFIKKGYFGLFTQNPKLADRVGDYVLCMKENYIFFDEVLGENKHINKGNHAGGSKEEMFVPLVVFKV